jgi:hypothetical protein
MIKRTVTARKVAANQTNAKRSTGPRTDWGKFHSRFNAIKSGLFAKQLVIRECDGEDAQTVLDELLVDLRQEFQPIGVMENWLVEDIAGSMWRLRRAGRAERGSCLVQMWDGSPGVTKDTPRYHLTASLANEQAVLSILDAASEEIARTGSLSKATQAVVGPLVCGQRKTEVEASETEQAEEVTRLVDDDFKRHLENKRFFVRAEMETHERTIRENANDFISQCALPPSEQTDKILRYEGRMRKQLEWSLTKLAALQKKRKSKRALPGS